MDVPAIPAASETASAAERLSSATLSEVFWATEASRSIFRRPITG